MRPRYTKIRARRMRYHHIPSAFDDIKNIPLIMRAGALGREKITRHRNMHTSYESIPNASGIFTSDQYSQIIPPTQIDRIA